MVTDGSMVSQGSVDVLAAFFLDGAKIIFGSLVVGIFVPGAISRVPWLTLATGMAMTVIFLAIAVTLAKKDRVTS